jgi:hypothetical protein
MKKNETTPETQDSLTPRERRIFERIQAQDAARDAKNADQSAVTRMPQTGDMQSNVQFSDAATRIVSDKDTQREGQRTSDYRTARQVELGRAPMGHGFSVVHTRFGYSIEQEGRNLTGDLEDRIRLFYSVAQAAQQAK